MKKFCLIGQKLPHTKSPVIFKHFGYEYSAVEIEKAEDIPTFMANCDFDGFNVTVPYKRDIMKYLDVIDEDALEIGAVNTVVYRDGKWRGYNTDILGMEYALAFAGISIFGKVVAIFGSGGTCKTALALCKKLGAREVCVVSRSGECNYDNFYIDRDVQIVINTTPVGMFPNTSSSPFDISLLCSLEGVFDAIYNPLSTELLLQAKSLGIKWENGLRMLVEQARAAKDIWLCQHTDRSETERVFSVLLREEQNIVLVGMPSCGKSTVGRILSERLGMELFDSDSVIEEMAGKTIPQIFETEGEGAFRKLESDVIASLSQKRGVIISTGGGAVLSLENRKNLCRQGFVCYLKKDIELLTKKGRPVSQANTLESIFLVRKPLYEGMADICVANNNESLKASKKIIKELKMKMPK